MLYAALKGNAADAVTGKNLKGSSLQKAGALLMEFFMYSITVQPQFVDT